MIAPRRHLGLRRRTWLVVPLASLALASCGGDDGQVDDPALPYSFAYPDGFQEGGESTVSAREQGYDNQTIVAKENGQDLVAVQTQPLRRPVNPELVPRIKREVAQSARRIGRVSDREDVKVDGLDGVGFEMSLRGTGVRVGARWIYAPKDRTLYWINCQWQRDRAGVERACDQVLRTFNTR